MKSINRIQWIINAGVSVTKNRIIKDRLMSAEIYSKYCEPGYHTDGLIVISNWNDYDDNTMDRVGLLLGRCGCELEWEDEWIACSCCNGIVRTSPSSYGWKRSYYVFDDGDLYCEDCLKNNAVNDYLEDIEGDCNKAITLDVDPSEYGYIRVNMDFENGFHYGQNDDPKNIGKVLKSHGITRFVFLVDDVGQFDIGFSVWIHESELEDRNIEEIESMLRSEVEEGPNIAENTKKALQQAAIQKIDAGGGKFHIQQLMF